MNRFGLYPRLSSWRPHAAATSALVLLISLAAVTGTLIAPLSCHAQTAPTAPITARRWIETPPATVRAPQPRLALVIGNTHYDGTHELKNPQNDARAVASALKELGFTTTVLLDGGRGRMRDEVHDFCDQIRAAGPQAVALLYYSGHGMQVAGENYLIPIGFEMPTRADDMGDNALSAQKVLDEIQGASAQVSIAVLDACRDNPFAGKKSYAAARGLARLEATGLYIAFATAAGSTSDDNRAGSNGTYTTELLRYLRAPGLSIDQVFKKTRAAVYEASHHEQFPYVYDGLLNSDTFSLAGPPDKAIKNVVEGGASATKTNPKDHAEMIWIPSGPFPMGDTDFEDNPRHTVMLSGYYIYKNLVTVAMYREFCQATQRKMPDPPKWGWVDDHPIVNVTWDDARAYADWAGVSLPTEAQWEKAARGTDGRRYPWGNDFAPNDLRCSTKWYGDVGSTHAIGGFPSGASPYGVLDMAGNVNQWCADWYDKAYGSNRNAPIADPVNDTPSEYRVVRGGSWQHKDSVNFRSAFRYQSTHSLRYDGNGFRCASPVQR